MTLMALDLFPGFSPNVPRVGNLDYVYENLDKNRSPAGTPLLSNMCRFFDLLGAEPRSNVRKRTAMNRYGAEYNSNFGIVTENLGKSGVHYALPATARSKDI
jgi:hypothetical protein